MECRLTSWSRFYFRNSQPIRAQKNRMTLGPKRMLATRWTGGRTRKANENHFFELATPNRARDVINPITAIAPGVV
jgi:hypothetical protein